MKKFVPVVLALALGALVARGSESYEVKISATEAECVESVFRRRGEFDEAARRLLDERKKFEARAAAIFSEICAAHQIDPKSAVVLNADHTALVVTPPPAAVASK